jgi:hypothetical protein
MSYVTFLRKIIFPIVEVLSWTEQLFGILLCEIIEANISPVKSIYFRYGMSFTGRYSEITVHLLLP